MKSNIGHTIKIRLLFLAGLAMAFSGVQAKQPAITALDIDKKISPFIKERMAEKNIPGVAFIVVKDGKILFKQGYGYADDVNKTPVDPDKSIFHIGSVTKLFTATAAMQLVEAGKLDMHTSVNSYLKTLKVDEPFGKPVTMANLLTHTGGLHYKLMGTVTPFGQVSEPLSEHLPEALPKAARTPGFVSVYSDYGMALAGHVIEAISGQRYQDYIDEHILQPLGMSQSGLVLTPERSLHMAMPGASDPANFPPADFNYSNFAPATEIHASAGDIAQFMLMHLGHKGDNVLSEKSRTLMQERQFSPHPSAFGWGYAFRENRYSGNHAIGHSGSWFKHLGRMTLFPEHDLGVYVVMNKRHKDIMKETAQIIADLFIPPKPALKPTGSEKPFSVPLAQFAGVYTTGQLTTTTTERLMMIIEPHTVFDITVEGNALVAKGERYLEMEPNFFVREDGERNLTFVRDPNTGDLYASFNGGGGNMRINWYEKPSNQGIFALLAFAGMVIGIFWQKRAAQQNSDSSLLLKLNMSSSLVAFLFIPTAGTLLFMAETLKLHISSPWWADLIFRLPWLVFILMACAAGIALLKRTNIHASSQATITAGLILYLAVLSNWNLF